MNEIHLKLRFTINLIQYSNTIKLTNERTNKINKEIQKEEETLEVLFTGIVVSNGHQFLLLVFYQLWSL